MSPSRRLAKAASSHVGVGCLIILANDNSRAESECNSLSLPVAEDLRIQLGKAFIFLAVDKSRRPAAVI
jgi:hypothetical protein